MPRPSLLPLLIAAPLAVPTATAQECEGPRLLPSGGAFTNAPEFGTSVAAEGNLAVAGSPDGTWKAGLINIDPGSAHVYELDGGTWKAVQPLRAPTVTNNARFGSAVDTDGVRIIVGENERILNPASKAGAAYVFAFDGETWTSEGMLTDSAPQANARLGSAVAISGTHALAGAPNSNPGGSPGSGEAFFFEFDGADWNPAGVFAIPGAAAGSAFGAAVALDGDRAAVSAPGASNGRGRVFLYAWNGVAWSFDQELPQVLNQNDEYGASLDLSGDLLLVGAPGDDDVANNSGAGYLWRFDGAAWSLEQKLLFAGGAAGDERGTAVGVEGDLAVVAGSAAVGDSGAAATFEFDGAVWADAALPAAPNPGDLFGAAAALTGTRVLIGAPASDEHGNNSGAVFSYSFSGGSFAATGPVAPTDLNAQDSFAFDIDLDAGRAVVGAPGDNEAASDGGSVYVMDEASGWSAIKLTASDPDSVHFFGNSVAIDGDTIAVGAPRDDTQASDAGAVYVFEFDGLDWNEVQKLTPAGLDAGDRFGIVVALDGDVLMGAAADDDDFGSNSGAVYVYRRAGGTWLAEGKLAPGDLAANDSFGFDIAVDGDTALIGCPEQDGAVSGSGAAYFFAFDGLAWVQGQKLLPAAPSPFDFFGNYVDLEGDLAIVASPADNNVAANSGVVDIYRSDGFGWNFEQQIFPPDGQADDSFGTRASISGDRILVGARLADLGAPDSGGAYLYRYDGTWTEESRFAAADSAADHAFGHAVVLDGSTALIAAEEHPVVGQLAGAAYVFDLVPERPLASATSTVSIGGGGSQLLEFATVPCLAGATYLMLGSVSGTSPGFAIAPGFPVPLNPDFYTVLSITQANGPVLMNSLGLLDAEGDAATLFTLPGGLDAGLAGLEIHHAMVVGNPVTGAFRLVSNAVVVELVP